MGAYNAPEPPNHTGNPITDVVVAYDWFRQFLYLRAPLMRIIASVLKDGATKIP